VESGHRSHWWSFLGGASSHRVAGILAFSGRERIGTKGTALQNHDSVGPWILSSPQSSQDAARPQGEVAAEGICAAENPAVSQRASDEQEHQVDAGIAPLQIDVALKRLEIVENRLSLDSDGARQAKQQEIHRAAISIAGEWPLALATDAGRQASLEVRKQAEVSSIA
jgi:hypothetical protein